MKKISLIIAIAILLTSVLVSCNAPEETEPQDTPAATEEQKPTETENPTESEKPTEDDDTQEKYTGEIKAATTFSEGYAFVSDNINFKNACCINTKGEIVFWLDKTTNDQLKPLSRFSNGHAVVERLDGSGYCLVNTKGEIVVSPETHGYTTSPISSGAADEAFTDGYFVVYNDDVTPCEYGVMGTDGKWILEMSSKYFESLNPKENLFAKVVFYDQGYVDFTINNYSYSWNLNQGTIVYPPNFPPIEGYWRLWSDGTYSDYTKQDLLDLNANGFTDIGRAGDFLPNADYTYVTFNDNTRFTLIDRNGEMLFEPIEITYNYNNIHEENQAELYFALSKDKKSVHVYGFDGSQKEQIVLPEEITSISGFSIATIKAFTDGSGYMLEIRDGEQYISGIFFVDNSGKLLF